MLKRNTADEIFWLLREKERENEVSIFVRNHAQGCHVGVLVKLLLPGDKEGQKKIWHSADAYFFSHFCVDLALCINI